MLYTVSIYMRIQKANKIIIATYGIGCIIVFLTWLLFSIDIIVWDKSAYWYGVVNYILGFVTFPAIIGLLSFIALMRSGKSARAGTIFFCIFLCFALTWAPLAWLGESLGRLDCNMNCQGNLMPYEILQSFKPVALALIVVPPAAIFIWLTITEGMKNNDKR